MFEVIFLGIYLHSIYKRMFALIHTGGEYMI